MKILKTLFLLSFLSFFTALEVDFDRASNISQNFFESRTDNFYNLKSTQIISEDEIPLLYVFVLESWLILNQSTFGISPFFHNIF
mgnify:CR=1 FL=1